MRAELPESEQSTEALAEAIGRLGVNTDPQDVDDYLGLIAAAALMESQARALLHDAVVSARSAGATWSAIGATLGMSKQAAQKRFSVDATPSSSGVDADERILGPVTAFDEMAELDLAGRYGWHSVEFGPFFHRVVRSGTQWEHARVTMLRGRAKARAMASEGWQVIGSEFPYTYLKRDLGSPALPEPDGRA
jgi:hypothetical protein